MVKIYVRWIKERGYKLEDVSPLWYDAVVEALEKDPEYQEMISKQ